MRRYLVFVCAWLILAGCGIGKKEEGNVSQQESAEPLVVESKELDYAAPDVKTAGGIQDAEGYYLNETFSRELLSEEEWDKALDPFRECMELPCRDAPSGFWQEQDGSELILGVYRDREGYLYYVAAGKAIRMLDPDGQMAAEYSLGAGADGRDVYVGDAIVSDAEKIIFPVVRYEQKTVDIVSFDRQTKDAKLLGQMEEQFFRNPLCALRGTKLFYRSSDWIVCWDMESGERTRFFDLKTAGAGERNVIMGFDEEGVPRLYIGGDVTFSGTSGSVSNEELVAVLGTQPVQAEITIRISDIEGKIDNDYVKTSAGTFQVKNRQIRIEYHTEENRDAYRNRVMAEVAGGKEPDIFCVNRADLHMLWEKGVIAPIDELLSEDTLDEILPGVRELGMADNEMAGLAPVIFASVLSTSMQDWDRDSWNMREFMEQTMKQGKKYAWIGSPGFSKAENLLQYAGIPSMEYMGLIDYQNGAAKLDSEDYRDLLRFCKEYAMPSNMKMDEYETAAADRESMADIVGFLCDFGDLERIYGRYAEGDCNLVGFPIGDAGYNYFDAVKYLAVSQKVLEDPEKKKAAADFLEYLVSEEAQKNIRYYLGVRRPTEENCYITDKPASEYNGIFVKEIVCMGRVNAANAKKEDGSLYLEEFKAFMEGCRGAPYWGADISKIICEEAEPYFSGERSVEEVAGATQNRVQLYLNERK